MSDVPPTLDDWIEAINAALGTSFEPVAPGQLNLEFESGRRIGVDFPDDAESYTIYSPIGLLDSSANLPRLLLALQLNLYQKGTAGGVIGLDMASGAIVYSLSYPVALSSPELLAQQIEDFVANATRLESALEQAASSPAAIDVDGLAESLGMVTADEAEAFEAAGSDLVDDEPSAEGIPQIRV
jgi:hypothetical protein